MEWIAWDNTINSNDIFYISSNRKKCELFSKICKHPALFCNIAKETAHDFAYKLKDFLHQNKKKIYNIYIDEYFLYMCLIKFYDFNSICNIIFKDSLNNILMELNLELYKAVIRLYYNNTNEHSESLYKDQLFNNQQEQEHYVISVNQYKKRFREIQKLYGRKR